VLVGGVIADTRRRDRGEEHVLDLDRGRGGLEVGEVALDRGLAAIGDRADAGMSRRSDSAAREFRLHEFGEALAIAPEPDRLIELAWPRLEPAQPLQAVIGPTGFTELAVVDHVDAGLGLLRHHLGDRALELALVALAVRRVGIARRLEQRLGSDQAADMGRQDALLAAFHLRAS
jgi:hypothetical protein